MATIQLNDQTINIPDYALESTQEAILNALKGNDKVDQNQLRILTDNAKNQKNANKKQQEHNESALQALKKLNEKADKTTVFANNEFVEGMKKAGKILGGVLVGAFGLVTSTLGALAFSAKSLGEEFRKTQGVGVGLDTTEMSAIRLAASMNALGFGTEQATQFLGQYASVIQTGGRESFLEMQRMFATTTDSGSNFGLTLQEAADVLAEDLELRQRLGILQGINESNQAKRSAALFQQQLEATAILGKSIDDIRDASKATLTDNASVALRIQAIAATLGDDAASAFTNEIQGALGDLAAIGVDQGIIDSIANEALDAVAFASDSGQALFAAMTALDGATGGMNGLTSAIQRINVLSKTDPAAAAEALNEFDEKLTAAATQLDTEAFNTLQIQLGYLGATGEQLAISLGQIRQAAERQAQDSRITKLAEGAGAFQTAIDTFGAGADTFVTEITGVFGAPMAALTKAFTEGGEDGTESVFGALRGVLFEFVKTFEGIFGVGEKGAKNFADVIRNKITPFVTRMGDRINNFIKGIDPESLDETVNSVIGGFQFLFEVATSLAGVFEKIIGFFIGTKMVENQQFDPTKPEGPGNERMVETFDLQETMIKVFSAALIYAAAKKAVVGAISGLFSTGMQSIGTALGNKMPGFGGGAGAGAKLPSGADAAKTGAGYGAGAVGMAAFGVAAAGVGVALFGLTNAIKTFADMSWGEIGKGLTVTAVALGLVGGALLLVGPVATASSLGLAALGVALLGVGAAAAGIGYAAQAIGSLFPSETEKAEAEAMRMQSAADAAQQLSDIPTERIEATASAITMLSDALLNMSNAVGNEGSWYNPFDNDSGADIDKQLKQVGVFEQFATLDGTAMQSAATGIMNMQDAYAKIAELDADKMLAVAEAMKEINKQTGADPSILDSAVNFFKDKMGFGSEDTEQPSPTPPVDPAVATADGTAGPMTPEGAKYIVAELGTKLDKVVASVDKSKKATTEAINTNA
jgi:hypothetical protein